MCLLLAIRNSLLQNSLLFHFIAIPLSLSLLAVALAGVITVRNDGAGAARHSCSLRSLLQLHTNTFLWLSTLKSTRIHVQHHIAYTHTHTCLTHTCLDTTWPLNLSWSHLISLSLSGLGSCSPAGVSVIACRGEEKLDLSSLILCLSLLVLTLSISHSTEDCRGKLPDKGESIQLMPLNYDKLALSGKNTR